MVYKNGVSLTDKKKTVYHFYSSLYVQLKFAGWSGADLQKKGSWNDTMFPSAETITTNRPGLLLQQQNDLDSLSLPLSGVEKKTRV